ncbi:hypothetical protein VE01_04188 [Pseudogymnoascus verrucosus]|uniref:Uncharacterized protein n=1 Tax=Pseudogymnoascus verrucosus TaxID=342668 RepID=A0A1B8GLP4_9PEZI|nr:uncharacterized protein VE01_04188 [Pseudogymnoascus verrucosus]OBT96761.1 hypothetical protein VE01_04188 [Pseudogymnoascus verrucosus]
MSYGIRANGLAFSSLMLSSLTLLLVFIMPIALQNIGWKMYIINGSWDIIILLIVKEKTGSAVMAKDQLDSDNCVTAAG